MEIKEKGGRNEKLALRSFNFLFTVLILECGENITQRSTNPLVCSVKCTVIQMWSGIYTATLFMTFPSLLAFESSVESMERWLLQRFYSAHTPQKVSFEVTEKLPWVMWNLHSTERHWNQKTLKTVSKQILPESTKCSVFVPFPNPVVNNNLWSHLIILLDHS